MSRRSGSRWNDRERVQRHQHQREKPPAVSDEDAMKALLFSAEQRTKEREGRNNDNTRRHQGNNGNYRGKSSRWKDKGNDSSKTNNEVSYYGPGGSRNSDNDRKRKRPLERGPGRRVDDPSRQRRSDDRLPVVEDDHYDGKSKKNTDQDGNTEEEEKPPPEFKPNFGLSGALAKDTKTGNVYKGVLLKFKEPPEARAPNTQWRFYVFKPKPKGSNDEKKGDDNELVETLHISKQSAYLCGRNTDIADIPMLHPSLSSQHAVLQYRAVPVPSGEIGAPPRLSCQPYIMDLESTNGTFLNGVRIDAARYYQLKRGDVLTFGASKREYVLLTENTTTVN